MKRKPEWLRVKPMDRTTKIEVQKLVKNHDLHTVCKEAMCPNLGECFGRRTATFMIMGNVCTRNCTFCCVGKGVPEAINHHEPMNIADAVNELNLKHVVITSVTRDDLEDGGASHFVAVIEVIRNTNTNVTIEVLIPDLQGNLDALKKIIAVNPDVINHNIETVPRLYHEVRPMANYQQSLHISKNVKSINPNILTKSGIMVGLGETMDEVKETLMNLRNHDCDNLTIGQYLQPSRNHHDVVEYIHPDIFKMYRDYALSIGFIHVASGPLVRSSYHAEEALT